VTGNQARRCAYDRAGVALTARKWARICALWLTASAACCAHSLRTMVVLRFRAACLPRYYLMSASPSSIRYGTDVAGGVGKVKSGGEWRGGLMEQSMPWAAPRALEELPPTLPEVISCALATAAPDLSCTRAAAKTENAASAAPAHLCRRAENSRRAVILEEAGMVALPRIASLRKGGGGGGGGAFAGGGREPLMAAPAIAMVALPSPSKQITSTQ